MTAVPFWGRRVKESQARSDRISAETAARERAWARTTKRLSSATDRAERAAVILISRHDDLLRVAARKR